MFENLSDKLDRAFKVLKGSGRITEINIAESLKEKGFDIDRKNITLPEDQIKEVGNYKAVIKLHRDVKVEIDFEIQGE